MKGRYQLPVYAKFNRPDPMRDWDWLRPHTLNLYEYCGNDPVNANDPNGMAINWVAAGVGALTGAAFNMAVESYQQYQAGKFDGKKMFYSAVSGAAGGATSGFTFGLNHASKGSKALKLVRFANDVGQATAGSVVAGIVERGFDEKQIAMEFTAIRQDVMVGTCLGGAISILRPVLHKADTLAKLITHADQKVDDAYAKASKIWKAARKRIRKEKLGKAEAAKVRREAREQGQALINEAKTFKQAVDDVVVTIVENLEASSAAPAVRKAVTE